MSETQNQQVEKYPVKAFFEKDAVKRRFEELLGKRSSTFLASVLQAVMSNDMLKTADPNSVYQAAVMAATLNLPINNNMGFAYIIPFRDRDKGVLAQFQIGYKGFIQLAQRTGQYKTISASPIYDGQLVEENPLTGFKFDFTKKESDKVIGYACYFSLINGFEKTLYMTIGDLEKHGKRFSQTFKKGFGLWKDDFDSMAQKTVIKLLISKFGPQSIEMQNAVLADQGIVKNSDTMDIDYVDNPDFAPEIDKEKERAIALIESASSLAKLAEISKQIDFTVYPDLDENVKAQTIIIEKANEVAS
jgi:recombination protein RecT